MNSVKLQRVNTIGVPGKGVQALFRFRVPYFDLKNKDEIDFLILSFQTNPKFEIFRIRYKVDSSAFALLFTEISVVWITEISVVRLQKFL